MQDLGTLGAGNDAYAEYVNERDQVAGWSYTNTTPNPVATFDCGNGNVVPTQDPFFWEKGTGMTDLGTFGGNCGVVRGLNNKGQVIGFSYLAGDVVYQPFRWDKKGGLKDLGLLGGVYGATYGINDAGDVVGWADLAGDVVNHAVLWPNGSTTPTDLGVVGGFATSLAAAINSKGQIIGCLTSDPSGNCFPYDSDSFLWEDGDMVDVNMLVPPHPGILLSGSEGYINDEGEIVLLGLLDNGDVHAILLTPCDDHHDGGDCEERPQGAAAAARSSSALVTRNPTAMTKGSPSAGSKMGAVHGRLRCDSQPVVPQSGNASEARADYITDEMPFGLSGRCLVAGGAGHWYYTGWCHGSYKGFCLGKADHTHCPRGKKAKQVGHNCGYAYVDLISACSNR